MSDEPNASASVNFTVKELIAQMRDELAEGLRRIEGKLDAKANKSRLTEVSERVDVLEEKVEVLERAALSAGVLGTVRAKVATGALVLVSAIVGGLTAHVHP